DSRHNSRNYSSAEGAATRRASLPDYQHKHGPGSRRSGDRFVRQEQLEIGRVEPAEARSRQPSAFYPRASRTALRRSGTSQIESMIQPRAAATGRSKNPSRL